MNFKVGDKVQFIGKWLHGHEGFIEEIVVDPDKDWKGKGLYSCFLLDSPHDDSDWYAGDLKGDELRKIGTLTIKELEHYKERLPFGFKKDIDRVIGELSQ